MNKLKVGDFIVFKEEFPCKITMLNKSKPGKHGSCKYALMGKHLITDKSYSMGCTSHDKPDYVTSSKDNYFGYYVDDDNYCDLTLDDKTGETQLNIKLTDGLAKEARSYEDGFAAIVTTLTYLSKGKEKTDQFVDKVSKMD